MWVQTVYNLTILIAACLVLYAAFSDFKAFHISNYISIALVALYPVAVLTAPVDVNWVAGLSVGAGAFVLGFGLFALGLFGGGDVKLISALCLWAGIDHLFSFLIYMALAGGLLVVFVLGREAFRKSDEASGTRGGLRAALRARAPVPYGVAIALGGLKVFYSYAYISGIDF
ncbi:A24 family peptidase [Sneathiella chinensis]|uniref:Type 4 prepilin peptidase 1 n=1 Tax=Sneathiella chinensis TaxID=349750 RepID=A0ABQ5U4F7_9PROT|nr:prepilin peptidase [Sneathiella chinensis]GLQ06560.1 type 4 prepilin peptidase 1 [Sneathiella chinensis]